MAREHPDLRLNLEQLNRLYPDREMLTLPEVMKIMGWGSANTVRRNGLPTVNGKVTKVSLARYMCGG